MTDWEKQDVGESCCGAESEARTAQDNAADADDATNVHDAGGPGEADIAGADEIAALRAEVESLR